MLSASAGRGYRGLRVVTALIVLSSLVLLPQSASLAANGVRREAGSGRYSTGAVVSRRHFGAGVPAVYIVNGERALAQAMTASAAAGKLGAPVLLVTRTSIPSAVRTELARLNPGRILVVGDGTAVSIRLFKRLGNFTDGPVRREAGSSNAQTSAIVSKRHFSPGVGVVYVVNGSRGLEQALAAGPTAAKLGGPILLVNRRTIPSAVRTELARLDPHRIVVVGPASFVSNRIFNRLDNFTTGTVRREAGRNDFHTSAVISRRHYSPGVPFVYIANGESGPAYAMAGGAAAAKLGGPMLYVTRNDIPSSVASELERLDPARIIVVGPSSSVSHGVMVALEQYITAPNTPPVAVDDDLGTLVSGCGWQVQVVNNDADATDPHNQLEVTAVSDPPHGTATILSTRQAGVLAPRVVRYVSDDGYTGPDSITYTVTDPRGASDQAQVSVNMTGGSDADDDNVPDACDAYASDPSNGSGASVPFQLTFDGGDGGLADTGFVGVMTNSHVSSLSLLDGDVGLDGLGGLVNPTVDSGDAAREANSQRNALQANIELPSGNFVVHGTVCDPYPTGGGATVGIYFGRGDQDNYIRAAIGWNPNRGMNQVQDFREVNGQGSGIARRTDADIASSACVHLYLAVNRNKRTYAPSYSTNGGATRRGFGGDSSRRTVPADWLDSPRLAFGIIATSRGPSPQFQAIWRSFEVTPQ
jgi:putative cell wall-binding protein